MAKVVKVEAGQARRRRRPGPRPSEADRPSRSRTPVPGGYTHDSVKRQRGCSGTRRTRGGFPVRTAVTGSAGPAPTSGTTSPPAGRPTRSVLPGVAAQALDELQDYISEANHAPWPGQLAQPRARAQVRGRMLLAWYEGTEHSSGVVLAIEPVPLAELQRRPGPRPGRETCRVEPARDHRPPELPRSN